MAQAPLLQGTLDLLILRTLALGPMHGVAVADRIKQVTSGTFDVKAGSLFPALHRLEAEGWVSGEWGAAPTGRRARLYVLTPDGRKHLATEQKSWARVSFAIQQVLEMGKEA
jgi:PadR family transcriptional regulator, regulatory protein PadR